MSIEKPLFGQGLAKGFPPIGEAECLPWAGNDWTLEVDGEVEQRLLLTIPELLQLGLEERTWDTICVTGWTHLDHRWRGVMLEKLLAILKPLPTARFIRFIAHSSREHDTSLPLDYALKHVLLAHELDGSLLEAVHGGPLRSVCEGKYFYKSVKWLKRIELLADDRLGYWERESSYHNNADPTKEERYVPSPLSDEEFQRRVDERNFAGAFAIMDEKFETLGDVDLSDALFQGARIKGCKLNRTVLCRIQASGANFTRTEFAYSDLRGADLSGCDLEGANFQGADLRDGDLRRTFLTATRFFHQHVPAKISGARFLRADIEKEGVNDLNQQFLLNAANGAIIE